MRKQRRLLPQADRDNAARSLARVAARHRILRAGARIAAYMAYGSEIDVAPLAALARKHGCRLYLPSIVNVDRASMVFVPYDAHTPLKRNRYGILEPDANRASPIPAIQFDVVLMPLVAVDAEGWRLGSGAGYYDRYFKHLRAGRRWRKPRLIGVAYDFQRVPSIEHAHWDVPLDAVLTDRSYYTVKNSS